MEVWFPVVVVISPPLPLSRPSTSEGKSSRFHGQLLVIAAIVPVGKWWKGQVRIDFGLVVAHTQLKSIMQIFYSGNSNSEQDEDDNREGKE